MQRRTQANLIFTHIPKTGGMSFMRALNHVYGGECNAYNILGTRPEHDELLYVDYDARKALWDEAMEKLPPQINFLTDHVPVQLFDGWLPNVKRVTWLRDPVHRVISHYTYAEHEHSREALQYYISRPRARNVMTFYTAGGDLDRFFFVGIAERFTQDLARLARLLDWPPDYPIVHINECKHPGLKEELLSDPSIVSEIEELNQQDRELYRRAAGHKIEAKCNSTST